MYQLTEDDIAELQIIIDLCNDPNMIPPLPKMRRQTANNFLIDDSHATLIMETLLANFSEDDVATSRSILAECLCEFKQLALVPEPKDLCVIEKKRIECLKAMTSHSDIITHVKHIKDVYAIARTEYPSLEFSTVVIFSTSFKNYNLIAESFRLAKKNFASVVLLCDKEISVLTNCWAEYDRIMEILINK